MATTIKNFHVENSGNSISYIDKGEGKPVLLLHGLAASHHDWDVLVPELVAKGYKTTCPDLPGHGNSFKPEQLDDYHLENVFQMLLEWMESLDIPKPMTVIGHSLGGYLSLELTLRYPEWVDKLVLVDPYYSSDQIPRLYRLGYRENIIRPVFERTVPEWIYPVLVELNSVLIPGRRLLRHDLPAHVRKQMVENLKLASTGIYKLPLTARNLEPLISQINIPTLLVYGIRDQTLTPSSFPKLAALIQNVLVKAIGAGHTPHQSNSEEFNKMVLDFLAID